MAAQSSTVQSGSHDWESRLESKVRDSALPRIPRERCIYYIPSKLRGTNPDAYRPSEISIGPIHKPRDAPDTALGRMEDIKMSYYHAFISRARVSSYTYFSSVVRELEPAVTDAYEHPINNKHCFLETIVVDSCFIIELFLKSYDKSSGVVIDSDQIMGSRKENDIYHEMILEENQVPFFVLQKIFESAGLGLSVTFLEIACIYFKDLKHQPKEISRQPLHFTDLVRDFILPPPPEGGQVYPRSNVVEHVCTVSQLWESGLKFQVSSSECLFDIELDGGKLSIPKIVLDEASEVMFRNIVALEQCHYWSSPVVGEFLVTEYLFLMHLLVQSERDAQILMDNRIIVNWTGEVNAVPALFKNLCSKVILKNMSSKYVKLCDQLNVFHHNCINKCKAKFWHIIYNEPWRLISCAAGANVLVLEYVATIIAGKQYKRNC